jgi:hypothetical protein
MQTALAEDRGEEFVAIKWSKTDVLTTEASHSPSPDLLVMVVISLGGAISTNITRCVETRISCGGGAYYGPLRAVDESAARQAQGRGECKQHRRNVPWRETWTDRLKSKDASLWVAGSGIGE